MRIDRIDTDTGDEFKQLELHGRLTVIASTNSELRREAFGQAVRALEVSGGTAMELRTEDGEPVRLERSVAGDTCMIDPDTGVAIDPLRRGLGVVGQLNDADRMRHHLKLLHISVETAHKRITTDASEISIAQGPLDRLWSLANIVQRDREELETFANRGDDITQAARERETREQSVAESLQLKEQDDERGLAFDLGGLLVTILAVPTALFISSQLAIVFALTAFTLFLVGAFVKREAESAAESRDGHSAFRVQLSRLDELFDTDSISRREKRASANLQQSLDLWHELAGPSDPSTLLENRRRITELSNIIRLLRVDQASQAKADIPPILLGLAGHLSELSCAFPAERVPLLVDDFFAEVPFEFHCGLLEVLLRAGQGHQLVLESGDMDICGWAAAEAVLGHALLITDEPVEYPTVIEGAVVPSS